MIHNNSLKDWIEHLNTKCAFPITYNQEYDVVLLKQLDISGSYYKCLFHVSREDYRDTESL